MSAQDPIVRIHGNTRLLVPSDVPNELWLEIALDLDALDVLALSKVPSLIGSMCDLD